MCINWHDDSKDICKPLQDNEGLEMSAQSKDSAANSLLMAAYVTKSPASHTYPFLKTTAEENRESGKLQRGKKKKEKKDK